MKRKARGQEQGADWFRRKPMKTGTSGHSFPCLPISALYGAPAKSEILWGEEGQGSGRRFRAPGAATFCHSWLLISAELPGRGSAHTPWGNFLLVQKVTKNTLRGFTPKDPKFLEQGRGVYCFARRIDSGITYVPWHSP